MRIRVKVVPGSSRDQWLGEFGDGYKAKVKAPPERGKANRAVMEMIAKEFGVDQRQVELVSGASSSLKVFEFKTA